MITVDQARGLNPEQRKKLLGQVEAVLKRDKRNIDALLSGAALLYTANATVEAIGLLKRAHKVQPKNPMIIQWLSVATAEVHEFADAKLYSKKLVEIDPANPENWQVRGRILDSSGDPVNALAAFKKQLSMTGETAELVFQMANCRFYIGELEEAEKGYRRAIELDPLHSTAIYGLSTIRRFSKDEVPVYLEQVNKAAKANKSGQAIDTASLYYGAGKALDDIKDFDAAFSYYKKANEAMNPNGQYDYLRPYENYKAAFNPELVEARTEWGDRSRRPIFVLGMPRSGTTLVESILGAHPRITAGGEMGMLEDLAFGIGAFKATPEEFAANVRGLSRKDASEMAQFYLRGVRAACGKDNLFTDKMPHNFTHIGLIFLLFPNAKIFHCRRDPVDTCVSIYTNGMSPAHNYYKTDLAVLGDYYRHYDDLMQFWHDLFPGRIHDIYYEDVVANTELNSRAMIEHVGLNWDDRVLLRNSENSAVKTLSAWQVRQPVYATAMGKWRRYESHLGPLLEALGDVPQRYAETLEGLSGGEKEKSEVDA